MAQTTAERRHNQRYGIHIPVHFRISQKGAASRWGTGITSDISSSGVGFRCRRPPPLGTHVELIIDWPAKQDEVYPVDLQATGFIVRSTGSKAAVRIASRRFRVETAPAESLRATARN